MTPAFVVQLYFSPDLKETRKPLRDASGHHGWDYPSVAAIPAATETHKSRAFGVSRRGLFGAIDRAEILKSVAAYKG